MPSCGSVGAVCAGWPYRDGIDGGYIGAKRTPRNPPAEVHGDVGPSLAAELLNCAVERLAPRRDQLLSAEVRLLKDAAAAGVLTTSVAAAVIGVVIFLPRGLAAFR
jgi:hypothetical protein